MNKNYNNSTDLIFHQKCRAFLKKFLNDKHSMNPYWQKINSTISNIDLNKTFDEIVEHLNQKKLTTYLNSLSNDMFLFLLNLC